MPKRDLDSFEACALRAAGSVSMKVASLIVAVGLALASGAPAQPALMAGAAGTVAPVAQRAATTDDTVKMTSTLQADDGADASAARGTTTYLLLALGLFGMGLVSHRRAK